MGGIRLRILLIDDDEDSFVITRNLLCGGEGSVDLEWAGTFDAGVAALRHNRHDACLLDFRLGAQNGLELLQQALGEGCRVPIIMLTGTGNYALDVQAMKGGAADYLVKADLDAARLERAIRYAIEREQLMARLEESANAEHLARLELEKAHGELRKTFEELKRTQAQLIQAEKMSALGQLVAGVAHEINNPLAFVKNNVAIVGRDVKALCNLVALYRQVDDVLARNAADLCGPLFRRIQECGAQMDLDYTLPELESILGSSADGIKRIEDIVGSLRDFARGGDELLMGADLNDGIESTLVMLRGHVEKRKVALETHLPTLPTVFCFPAKINQVVLNLVLNAIDACAANGQVTVRTHAADDGVEIHVIDTGCGIDPAIRARIFDPFFTTKPVGQGTGLGLSISYAIIKEHGGRIEVDSTPGRGSHFTVFLPLQPPPRPCPPS